MSTMRDKLWRYKGGLCRMKPILVTIVTNGIMYHLKEVQGGATHIISASDYEALIKDRLLVRASFVNNQAKEIFWKNHRSTS